MLATLAQRIETVAAHWARRRQGADEASGVTLKRRRVYILPTRYGAVFGLVVFAMLLGSTNYGASLGFVLTFLLTGLALVVMHHCNNNLVALRLRFAGAQPVFAGHPAKFRIAVTNGAGVPRRDVEVSLSKDTTVPVDIEPEATQIIDIFVPTDKRGWLPLERFAVATQYPGNLFRSWTWVHMPARCLVYPQAAPPGRALPEAPDGGATGTVLDQGDADFYGLRAATPSDSPKRIAWKAYARNEELLIKQFAGAEPLAKLIDWDMLPELETEPRIAQLTRWCLDAAEQSRNFGLRLPGKSVPLGRGSEHLHACLAELAVFEPPAT
jgi:uncharacterized protein (DUF58 family)